MSRRKNTAVAVVESVPASVVEMVPAPVVETPPVVQTAATEVVLDGLAELKAKQAELRTKKRLLMEVESRRKWEEETLAINPNYVMGSLRPATPEDTEILGHCHGQVCLIRCEACGTERLINKQDARQVRFCKSCKKSASSSKAKERRLTKKLANTSAADIQAQIDALNAQLGKMAS